MRRTFCTRIALAALLLPMARGAAHGQDALAGVWAGSYRCMQGVTGLALHLADDGGRGTRGVFHFFPLPENPAAAEGCFTLSGPPSQPDGVRALSAGRWLLRPPGYVTVDLAGRLDESGSRLAGDIIGPGCTGFAVQARLKPPRLPPACRPDTPGDKIVSR